MRTVKIKTSYEVVFSPDGSTILCLGGDVNLWSINSRKKKWKVHPFKNPSHGTFSPDGSSIAVKNTAGQIVVLSAATGETEFDLKNQSEGEGSNVIFSLSGDQLIDGSWNGLLNVRNRFSGGIIFQAKFQGEMITRIHQPLNGTFFISEHYPKATTYDKSPDDCYFLRWSWPIGVGDAQRLPITFPFITSSAISYSGDCIVVAYGAPPNKMVLYDLNEGSIRWEQEVQIGGSGSSLKWSPCGRFIGAVQNNRIAIYSSDSGMLIGYRQIPYPSDVDFSQDTTLIAFGAWQEGFIENFVTENLEKEGEPSLPADARTSRG